MKKILSALIAVILTGSLCFAADTPAKPDETKTFIGKIDSITRTISRSAEGPYCKIIAVSENGEKYTFFVLGTTSVNDVKGKDMSEGGKTQGGLWLKKGQRVEIKYSIITGGSSITDVRNEAILINCLD